MRELLDNRKPEASDLRVGLHFWFVRGKRRVKHRDLEHPRTQAHLHLQLMVRGTS